MAIDKEKTLQAAQRAVEKKKFDLAIEEYRKLAAVEKNDPRWLLKIGDLQQKKGDPAGAIATYEEVARFYGGQGFHLKAVAVYNTLRDLLLRQPPALQAKYQHVPVKLAELYEKLQLTSDALATWDAVADRLQKEGRDKEACDVYRRIVGLDPSNPLAHLRLAEALSRIKDIEGAIAEVAATAEQLTAQTRVDDAIKVYERLLHHRQDPKYARPAAELYLQRGGANDGVAAIAKIQVCLKSDPKSVELIALLARGFVAIGQLDKAITIYKESARLAGDQGKHELRKDIVKRLQGIAPNDDQVRALVQEVLHARGPSQPEPAPPEPVARHVQLHPEPEEDLELEDDDDVPVESREVAEELETMGAQSLRPKAARVAEVVANADSFRRVKLYAKALTTLRIGLELDPRSIAVRERMRDILIETGETDLAIAEMVSLSAILLEDGDLQGAYDNLAWVLEADPEHPQAVQLMEQLQVLAGNVPAEQVADVVVAEDEQPVRPEAPREAPTASAFDELDEPALDAPLPSYAHDLDEPALDEPTDTGFGQTGETSLPAYAFDEAPFEEPPTLTGPGSVEAQRADGGISAEIEAALEEADFYAQQGVFETARETLEEALRASPNHRLLLEKLRELDALARGSSSSMPAHAPLGDDRAFDIAASLDALDDVEPVPAQRAHGAEQVDVDDVFQKFKLGVAQQVEESDSATHYDLGVAYDQMMLFDDAVAEFRIAARDPSRTALCHSMIGVIHEKQGKVVEAIESYEAGLHAELITQDEELALLYQLALAWEQRSNKKEAVYYLRRLIAISPGYRDARQRLHGLESVEQGSGTRRRDAIEDNLDAAFDEVMDKPKGK